ncbi:AraC family transcriptional regulator [Pseudomonas sp. L-22-4S-12]|nr:AraC family transcriptional regulator [Pseudomonas sp. L-22-4S-12]
MPAAATLDTQTYSLILSLEEALAAAQHAEKDALCRVSRQLCEHLLERYQQPTANTTERLALAPWQERKAKQILERSLNARLLIADVAEQCAMSRSHFSRAFKKATGMSPQEWSLDLRIRRAKDFLAAGSLSISQISLECGFADQSHFSRMFSKLVGVTPKRWQRLNSSLAQSA